MYALHTLSCSGDSELFHLESDWVCLLVSYFATLTVTVASRQRIICHSSGFVSTVLFQNLTDIHMWKLGFFPLFYVRYIVSHCHGCDCTLL